MHLGQGLYIKEQAGLLGWMLFKELVNEKKLF
jgi:hypothetical protein